MKITVRNGDVEKAIRLMKKKLQQEGVIREMRMRQNYEKPSAKRRRIKNAGMRRAERDKLKLTRSKYF